MPVDHWIHNLASSKSYAFFSTSNHSCSINVASKLLVAMLCKQSIFRQHFTTLRLRNPSLPRLLSPSLIFVSKRAKMEWS